MKKYKTGIICGVIALAALTGCVVETNSEEQYTYEEVENWTTTGKLRFDEEGNPKFSGVELNFRTICDSDDAAGLQMLVEEFNTEYNGKIKINFFREGQGSYYTNLARQISNDSGAPDLCMFHSEQLTSLQFSHLFQPVDDVLTAANLSYDENDYFAGVTKGLKVGKHQYGFPIDAHTSILMYRKDLLEKYSLTYPTTYQELISVATTIQNGERATNSSFRGIAASVKNFTFTQYAFYSSLYQNGFEMCDESNSYRPDWLAKDNVDAMKDSIEVFRSFFHGDPQLANIGTDELVPETEMIEGNCAFMFCYPWRYTYVSNLYVQNGGNIEDLAVGTVAGLLTTDATKATKNNLFVISHCFAIPRTVTGINTKAASMFFAKWFSEKCAKWANYGHMPMNKDLLNSEEYQNLESVQKVVSNFGDPEYFSTFAVTPFYQDTRNGLHDTFVACIADKNADVERILTEKYNAALGKINATIAN